MNYIRYLKRTSLIIICLFLLSGCLEHKKFPDGKDTYKSFGDGSIQLLYLYDSDKTKNLVLFDLMNQSTIDSNVYGYKYINKKLYTKGEAGYTVLDISTHEFVQDEKVSRFQGPDQVILRKLNEG